MRAIEVTKGHWDTSLEVDQVLIDFDRRHRRRIRLVTMSGHEVLLDFPQAVRLRDGDGLVLEDGGIVRVIARPEALLDIEGIVLSVGARRHLKQRMSNS